MLYDQFRQFLVDERLDLSGRVLVGISGGADSVVLVDLVRRLGSAVTCLHVNYGLRGAESDGDEAFVRSFCERETLDLRVFNASGEMRAGGRSSVQALARQIRYREYIKEAVRASISLVLLGHHADDQVETILLNIFRGTGLNGLAGMPVSRPAGDEDVRIVRPLLFARRKDIEEYARTRGLSWREDSSNDDPGYRRVALRREVIPLIERHFGGAATDNVLRMAALARKMLAAGHTLASQSHDESDNALALETLEGLPDVMRTQIILNSLASMMPGAPRSQAIAEQIDRLSRQQTGRRVVLGGGAVVRERGALRFLKDNSEFHAEGDFNAPLEPGKAVRVPGGTIVAHQLATRPENLDPGSPNIVYLDARAFESTLEVTNWRPGDRITPFGAAGSKKVSDLLTDEKIPTLQRSRIPVVRSAGRIVWIVGVRPCAEFAVTDKTGAVITVIFLPDFRG